ncbi:unnamed protein product [Kluyveromyces dobzhanskii CBS 2104]|uniref:WGS project CCBQ000000000 data, contig 00011 n=1 Tax=Kluyveromyces dobzhanskii CBS 2104 TaxID=1427455 RepID=A0A0A8L7F9_9SACH|nr:unnamed protein product [Kluyveromyces dobzhanskii CBS 2104]
MTGSKQIRYYDIGFNISDHMFQGKYHGRKNHDSDLANVLNRCRITRVDKLLITGSSIHESKHSIKLCSEFASENGPKMMYTIGVHPCSVNEFVPKHAKSHCETDGGEELPFKITDHAFTKGMLHELYNLYRHQSKADDDHFRAIGEIGLDYDRLHFSGKEIQKFFFLEQLKLSCFFPNKPLFLHMRNCAGDFMDILKLFLDGFVDENDTFGYKSWVDSSVPDSPSVKEDGSIHYKFSPDRKLVVHSFTGSVEEMKSLLDQSENCYFSVNGCSMRSEESIEMIEAIPVDKLLLETDAPWCDVRRTHASYKFLSRDTNQNVDDAWNNGLSEAYPELDQWFKSVKKEKLQQIPPENWDQYMVKSRNEPCTMGHVATVVANVKQIPLLDLVDQVWHTSCSVYGE